MDDMTDCQKKKIFFYPRMWKHPKHSVYRKIRHHLVQCLVAYFLFLSLIYFERMTKNRIGVLIMQHTQGCIQCWAFCRPENMKRVLRWKASSHPLSALAVHRSAKLRWFSFLRPWGPPTLDSGRPSRSLGLVPVGFRSLLCFMPSERQAF